MPSLRPLAALCLLASLAAAGCKDPSADKPKATVSDPAAASASAVASAVRYAITPANSKVEWTGAKVTGSHDGSFKAFSGQVAYAGSIEKSTVTVDIDTTTIATSPDALLTHLASADFFDVKQYPKASFTSTSIKGTGGDQYTVTGNLDLHGVKKSITFPATITATPGAIDAKATFSINRKDFGITYAGKADDLIRDDVLLKLTIHAEKQG